ncbi:MAG: sigma-70 family RNA polymerase sigma factor [bacterium]|nr:sigma-70 family RNA polymerase sigma factor [bacterium]
MTDLADTFLVHVRPHWCGLHRVARRYAGGESEACDLVQEALLRAWRSFSAADQRTYRRSWFFVILRNVGLEWQRSRRSRSRRIKMLPLSDRELTDLAGPEPTEPLADLPGMSEAQFTDFLDQRIVAAIDDLEPVFREVLLLSVAGELTYREIAEVLDCPVGTVMSRMARARRSLRERLADFAGTRSAVRKGRS